MLGRDSAVLVTGGAGYIGSVLVPRLLAMGHKVTVLDRFFFGRDTLVPHERLELRDGDIRDKRAMDALFAERKFDAVIHLAAVSNDPSSELDGELTRAINRVALEETMRAAKRHGVRRFLYASSASVYGVKDDPEVHEDLTLEPLTLYARFKAEGEDVLRELCDPDFTGVSVRAATVCGWSPRLRIDLTVNILTFQALTAGKITVFGGSQKRPNVHVDDLVDFYVMLLDTPAPLISGRAFNVCHSNESVLGIAEIVRREIDPTIAIDVTSSNDLRSYHLSAERARRELDFVAKRTLTDAISDLRKAHAAGRVPDPADRRYRNVELMKRQAEAWRTVTTP